MDYMRRMPGPPQTVSRGQMRATPLKAQQEIKAGNPDRNYGLGVCRVVGLDYEGFTVTLRTILGTSVEFERVPIPLTFPGAGTRHFLGAMPEIGDYCVVGWMPQESRDAEGTKTPVILSWMIPGVWSGRDWLTTSEFTTDEYDLDAPADRVAFTGAYDRIRHKLRHIQPGNIVASSSQGSDLVLDEGVTLANRRGNEIRLRDQDQAIVLRSLQEFHALAGARVYAGMVQRDATFLPADLVSDGKLWDSGQQAVNGVAITENQLPPDPQTTEGFLTPAPTLRCTNTSPLGRSKLNPDEHLNPYQFLLRGGFINAQGYAVDNRYQADVSYGGKPIFRVTNQSPENATRLPEAGTLTEYRIEVTHTSKGRLPVTEQTDLFDAERLPTTPPRSKDGVLQLPDNQPFIEWVLGSVVGNDAYSQDGRARYGIPLKAIVFNGDSPAPRLEPVNLTLPNSGVSPTPLNEHAATLFRLTPPLETTAPGTFWSVNKQGQMAASFGGPANENSLEAYLNGGLKLGVGGRFQLLMNGHLDLVTRSKASLNLRAEEGPVVIYGGGPLKDSSAPGERLSGVGDGESAIPAVDIRARTNVRVKAERTVQLKGSTVELDATTTRIMGHEEVNVEGANRVGITTANYQSTVSGKSQELYTGPKYGLPTNAPLHEVTYFPVLPGLVCQKTRFVMGDREEQFDLGNHKTTVLVGDLTYETLLGTWTARSGLNSLELTATGLTGTATVGTVSLRAEAGAASMYGLVSATVSTAGLATLRGGTAVNLGAPVVGPDFGFIICAGTLEPYSGKPFGTWGGGAKNHLVVP